MDCISSIEGPQIINKNIELSTICYIKGCNLIAVGTDIGRMYFWDMNRSFYLERDYENYIQHKSSITCIIEGEDHSKSFKLMFSSGQDGCIIIWEIECILIKESKPKANKEIKIGEEYDYLYDNQKIRTILPKIETKQQTDNLYKYRYVPQIKSILNTNQLLNSLENEKRINIHSGLHKVNVVSYSCLFPTWIFSGGEDCKLHIWDFHKGILIKSLEGHESSIHCMTTDKYYLFTGSIDSQILIWNMMDQSLLSVLGNPSYSIGVNDIMMIESYGVLVSATSDKKINIWKYESKELIKSIPIKQESLCLNVVEAYGKIVYGTKEKSIIEQHLSEILNDVYVGKDYMKNMDHGGNLFLYF
jgi:WD40 repeat protein